MSLKEILVEYLSKHKKLSLEQLWLLSGREHKKMSNSERRFRELMSPADKDYNPRIKAQRNAKGAIIGYYWQEKGALF